LNVLDLDLVLSESRLAEIYYQIYNYSISRFIPLFRIEEGIYIVSKWKKKWTN